MTYFYDTKFYHPYLCFKDTNELELKKLVDVFKQNDLQPSKYYPNPKNAASNGIRYDYLFRLPFINDNKPEKETIDQIIEEFNLSLKPKSNTNNEEANELIAFIESEKVFINEIKELLNTERKILESDKQFFQVQIENVNTLSKNLRKETANIINSLNSLSDKINEDIEKVLNKNEFENQDLILLKESLDKREQKIKEREKLTLSLEKELLNAYSKFEEYKEEQEEIYRERINSLRAEMFMGMDKESEDNTLSDPFKNLKILIVGHSQIEKIEIRDIFNQVFEKNFDKVLPKKCIEIPSIDYEKMKSIDIPNKIKTDKFDYIILGPRPHSTKNKEINISTIKLKEKYNLKANIASETQKPLSKSFFEEMSINIANDWMTKIKSNE